MCFRGQFFNTLARLSKAQAGITRIDTDPLLKYISCSFVCFRGQFFNTLARLSKAQAGITRIDTDPLLKYISCSFVCFRGQKIFAALARRSTAQAEITMILLINLHDSSTVPRHFIVKEMSFGLS